MACMDFHLRQIIEENVGTWWCNVIDIIHVVVIKCCKYTKVSDSFRYMIVCVMLGDNICLHFTLGYLLFSSAEVK